MRSSHDEQTGWNALVDAELAREGGSYYIPPGGTFINATWIGRGLGNLSLVRVDETTLRLTIPTHAVHYAVRRPETIRVVVPAEALRNLREARRQGRR